MFSCDLPKNLVLPYWYCSQYTNHDHANKFMGKVFHIYTKFLLLFSRSGNNYATASCARLSRKVNKTLLMLGAQEYLSTTATELRAIVFVSNEGNF